MSLITLCVSDMKKSRAFYDALGWKVASEDQAEEIVAYNIQNMVLALYPWDKFAKEVNVTEPRPKVSAFTLAYNVGSEGEVDQTMQEAERAGGKIIKAAETVFWGGYSGHFADPDGNFWEVAYNPFSKLGPNKEFRWEGF